MSDLACLDSFAARGAGGNVVFVEPERELVIVLRWCGNAKAVIDRILASEFEAHPKKRPGLTGLTTLS